MIDHVTRRSARAVEEWWERIQGDGRPLIVQTRRVNESEGVTVSAQELEDAVRALYQAAKDGVIDDAAIEAFEQAAPQAWTRP